MIETIQICSNCRKQVPEKCDGILYTIEEMPHWNLCIGEMKKEGTLRIKKEKLYYHYIMGHGTEWDTPLIKK